MKVFLRKKVLPFVSGLMPLMLVAALSFAAPIASAQNYNGSSGSLNGSSGNYNGSSGGAYNGSSGNSVSNQPTSLQNPLGNNATSVCQLVNLLLKAIMIIGVPIAVLFIVYAGFKFVTSRGSPGEISEARTNLLNVIIGIAIFLGASLIAEVIFNTLKQLGVTGLGAC